MQTVIGAFDTASDAEKAAQDLVNAGIDRKDISLVANNEGGRYAPTTESTSEGVSDTGHAVGHDAIVGAEWGAGIGFLVGLTGLAIPGLGWIAGAGWLMGTLLGAGTGAVVGGLVGALTHVGVPHEDAQRFSAAVQHGSVLLAIRASEAQAHNVADILDRDGAINVEERVAEYEQRGFLPSPAPTTAPSRTAVTQENSAQSRQPALNANGEQVLPVVEENLEVGKRQVQRGGVRVFSHVTERPVEENVTLHEEHVTVDRHPVNRPAGTADFNTPNRVIEVTETAEVPVVSKEARVVEEVVVGKEATDRTETVRDTVRRTDVEVEQIPNQGVTATTGTAGNHLPGIRTGGHDADGTPDTRGITEKMADAVTGDRIDDKTGKPVD